MSDPIAVGDVFEYVHENETETHEVAEVREDEFDDQWPAKANGGPLDAD